MVLHVLWFEIPTNLSLGLIILASVMQVLSMGLYLRRNLSLIRQGRTA